MVKSVLTVIIAAVLIVCGAFLENYSLKKTFSELILQIDEITIKLTDGVAVSDDIIALKEHWSEQKRRLHVYIPHTEIKEVELWISESIAYVKYGKYDEAIGKLAVVKQLCIEIPKTFRLRPENIF